MALTDLTTAELLERLAARTPAPAAGSAAALAGALAAALVEMVSAFALTRGEGDDAASAQLHRRAAALRARLVELADEDVASYEPVFGALALDVDDPRRASALADALSGAANVPLQIAEASAEACELAALLTRGGARGHVLGDARAAVAIAEAAVAAAASLVELNLGASPRDERVGAAVALTERARRSRREAQAPDAKP
jgi:glutamate formiminotransferase/formiminotetrahydrofolate cyclodeaminase